MLKPTCVESMRGLCESRRECLTGDFSLPSNANARCINAKQQQQQKKNKRGDRGSLEETPNDVKRPNLDAIKESLSTEQLQDEDNMADEEKEPTLSQIRDMLRDLQKSVAAILRENNNLKEELSQMTKVTNENLSLASQLRKKLKDQEEETTRLWAEQDELEQYSRKDSLEIHSLPENVYSSTKEVVLKLAGALNVQMSASDIEISHKLRRKGKTFIIGQIRQS